MTANAFPIDGPYAWKIAVKPGFIMRASLSTSQLVMRRQPLDSARPIVFGSFVPWIP
jgi:hypothetical protein